MTIETSTRPTRAVYLLAAVLAVTALLVPGCAWNRATEGEQEVTISLFRGVNAKANGRATLSPSQFTFNPTLSTFDTEAGAPVQKPCNFQFFVTVDTDPPDPGDHGPVNGLHGYIATFDNDPPGHWGISKPDDVTPAEASAAVSEYAQGHREQVVNGTQDNCR